MRLTRAGLLLVLAFWAAGCSATPTDYRAFLDHTPKSVLVLAPLNRSAEALASDAFLSTVTNPLAESGYYVFPVAIVDRIMKENGLPTPGEMHQVPLNKLKEVFGADAVLYVTIEEWNQQYVVVSSRTSVTLAYRLVDVDSGKLLWQFTQRASSGRGGLSVQGMIEAALHAVVSAATDEAIQLAAQANFAAFANPDHGLLLGGRHPEFEANHTRHRQQQEELEASRNPPDS